MNRKSWKNLTDDMLVETYANEALQQSEAQSAKVANRRADAILGIAREMRRRGPEAQFKLLRLLEHPHARVRGWAATHALAFAPAKAEPVLRTLANEPGIPGLNAKLALREWKKGTLELP